MSDQSEMQAAEEAMETVVVATTLSETLRRMADSLERAGNLGESPPPLLSLRVTDYLDANPEFGHQLHKFFQEMPRKHLKVVSAYGFFDALVDSWRWGLSGKAEVTPPQDTSVEEPEELPAEDPVEETATADAESSEETAEVRFLQSHCNGVLHHNPAEIFPHVRHQIASYPAKILYQAWETETDGRRVARYLRYPTYLNLEDLCAILEAAGYTPQENQLRSLYFMAQSDPKHSSMSLGIYIPPNTRRLRKEVDTRYRTESDSKPELPLPEDGLVEVVRVLRETHSLDSLMAVKRLQDPAKRMALLAHIPQLFRPTVIASALMLEHKMPSSLKNTITKMVTADLQCFEVGSE
jgi:hypothetical protein